MTPSFPKAVLAAALSLGAAPSFAGTPVGDYLNFSGFGTVGLTRTNTDSADFIRDAQLSGATKDVNANVDSNFGLQVTATANPWLSATVQMLTMERNQSYMTTEAEWAFVKVKPLDGLTLRGGRMALPMFAVSDSRNVGYANTWLRPPGEVYGLAKLPRLDGADASYSVGMGSSTFTATAMAGKANFPRKGLADLLTDHLRGLNLQWEADGVTVRLGQVRTTVHTSVAGVTDAYKFSGAGVLVDRNNVVFQTEYVTRRSAYNPGRVNANGWYAMGGYRLGAWVPYASYSATKPTMTAKNQISGPQDTKAIGVRWDALSAMDVKFQLERIDTKGTAGVSFIAIVPKPVTAASVTVDFVF
jgi:hypothetical protein